VLVRPFTPADYPAVAATISAAYPDNPHTAAELETGDRQLAGDGRIQHGRLVAELGGEVVGSASYSQSPGSYNPHTFYLELAVAPQHQGRGVGAALYGRLLEAVFPLEPRSLRASAREDMARAARFWIERGFLEDSRWWESRLDVAAFDFAPYKGLEEKLRREGLTIRAVSELEGDPEMRRNLHALFSEVRLDVPRHEPATPIDFETWLGFIFDDPNLLPDAYFVALDGEEYVGLTNLWRSEAGPELYTGLTGVRREYRRRGLALALKLRAVRYALEHGCPAIRTDNESTNAPMLAVNDQLGFAKLPAWIGLVKRLEEKR